MTEKKSWEEFKQHGLLLFVNQILQIFGWSIVFELDNFGNIADVYPARTKFRGFDNKKVSENYKNLSKWMKDNAQELYEEACE